MTMEKIELEKIEKWFNPSRRFQSPSIRAPIELREYFESIFYYFPNLPITNFGISVVEEEQFARKRICLTFRCWRPLRETTDYFLFENAKYETVITISDLMFNHPEANRMIQQRLFQMRIQMISILQDVDLIYSQFKINPLDFKNYLKRKKIAITTTGKLSIRKGEL